MADEPSIEFDQSDAYRQLDNYPWDQDSEFQGGLSAILGPHPVPSQIHDLTLRARCFYFSRKTSVPVSFNAYKSYLLALESQKDVFNSKEQCSLTTTSYQASLNIQAESSSRTLIPKKAAPYPPSFAEIISLIAKNSPIPGIRDIPSTVIPEQASVAVAPMRKKPWDSSLLQTKIDSDKNKSGGEDKISQISIEAVKQVELLKE